MEKRTVHTAGGYSQGLHFLLKKRDEFSIGKSTSYFVSQLSVSKGGVDLRCPGCAAPMKVARLING